MYGPPQGYGAPQGYGPPQGAWPAPRPPTGPSPLRKRAGCAALAIIAMGVLVTGVVRWLEDREERATTWDVNLKANEDATGFQVVGQRIPSGATLTLLGHSVVCTDSGCPPIVVLVAELTPGKRTFDASLQWGSRKVTRTFVVPAKQPAVRLDFGSGDPTSYCGLSWGGGEEQTKFVPLSGDGLAIALAGNPGDTFAVSGRQAVPAGPKGELTVSGDDLTSYIYTWTTDKNELNVSLEVPVEETAFDGTKVTGKLKCLSAGFLLPAIGRAAAAGRLASRATTPPTRAVTVLSAEDGRVVGEKSDPWQATYVAIVVATVSQSQTCHYTGGRDAVFRTLDHALTLYELRTGKQIGARTFALPKTRGGADSCPATLYFDKDGSGGGDIGPGAPVEDHWLTQLARF